VFLQDSRAAPQTGDSVCGAARRVPTGWCRASRSGGRPRAVRWGLGAGGAHLHVRSRVGRPRLAWGSQGGSAVRSGTTGGVGRASSPAVRMVCGTGL